MTRLRAGTGDVVERFRDSMQIGYEEWHDGIGYAVDLIDEASEQDRAAIEQLLRARAVRDWRDVEALARLNTAGARETIRAALGQVNGAIDMAILRHAPRLCSPAERTAALRRVLEGGGFGDGLTQALDLVAEEHPPEIVDALLRGTLLRPGEIAVHFAAMLFYIHGLAREPFDWAHRPFFLRFNTSDASERRAACDELTRRIERL